MTPRSFRPLRSRAFWFGVPGLVFLQWGWWLSTGHWSRVGVGGVVPWGIGQNGGEVYARWNSAGGLNWGRFVVAHGEMTGEEAREMKLTLAAVKKSIPSLRYVFIPYY